MGGVLEWAGAIVLFGGAIAAIVTALRWASRHARRISEFLDDWAGEPARHGVDERPGVLARLHAIEREVTPNGGQSLRDAVTRVEASLTTLDGRLQEHLRQPHGTP
jgi:hypothetical protein